MVSVKRELLSNPPPRQQPANYINDSALPSCCPLFPDESSECPCGEERFIPSPTDHDNVFVRRTSQCKRGIFQEGLEGDVCSRSMSGVSCKSVVVHTQTAFDPTDAEFGGAPHINET